MVITNNKVSFIAEEPNRSHENHRAVVVLFFFNSTHMHKLNSLDTLYEARCIIFMLAVDISSVFIRLLKR